MCNECATISPRVLYQHVCCTRCYRRLNRTQPDWELMARCVWVDWAILLLLLCWMAMEDTRNYFADAIEELHQRRHFVDVLDDGDPGLFQEAYEGYPSYAQESCSSKPFEGLEQCLPWYRRFWVLISHVYSWLTPKMLQKDNPTEGYSMNTTATHQEIQALEVQVRTYMRMQIENMDEWERALHREWSSLISRSLLAPRCQMEGTLEDGMTTSESIQPTPAR